MAEEAVSTFCDPSELSALTAMFKGNATAAEAFCTKLNILGTADGESVPGLQDRIAGIEEGLNTFFLTINGALVFIMHAGFAMVSLSACNLSALSCVSGALHDLQTLSVAVHPTKVLEVPLFVVFQPS